MFGGCTPLFFGTTYSFFIILDGPVIINMLQPTDCSTSKDYALKVFSCARVDNVWDVYRENTLKASERRKRGHGIFRRVLPDSKIPGNWHSFLHIDENKEGLVKLLAVEASKIQTNKVVVSTYG